MPESVSAATNQVLLTGRKYYFWDGTDWRPALSDTAGAVKVSNVETIETELLAHTAVAASAQAVSSVLSLVGVKKATVFIDHGRAATAAFGTAGTEYRIEVSQKASGNDTWRALTTVVASSVAASSIKATADTPAGSAVIASTSATTLVKGDIIYWANTVTVASGEWGRVVVVAAGTSITLQDALTNAQDSDTNIYNKGEQFVVALDVEAKSRMRVVVNNNNSDTSQAIQSRVACITEK